MKFTKLTIIEEKPEGVVIGYSDGGPIVDIACTLQPSHTGPNSDTDALDNAEMITRTFNSYPRFLKALRDTIRCLDEAAAVGREIAGVDTKRWAAAASQAHFILDEAKQMEKFFAD